MRFSDFKNPLVESVQQQLDKNLDQVGQMVDQGEDNNPVVADKVKGALSSLLARAKQALAQRKGQPQEAIEEDAAAATFDIIEELKSVVAQLCGSDPSCDDPIAVQMNQKISTLLKQLPKAFSAERDAGAEDEFQGEKKFAVEFGQAIKRIAGKATGTLEALEAHYKQQAQENPDRDQRGVEAPDQTQVEKAVEDTLQSVFSSAAFGGETRQEKQKTRAMLKNFLNDCVKGIIELGPLLDQKQGNIIEAFKNTKYGELTDFFNELLGKVPAGSGAGSWGPAELALSVVGTPVNKAEKGDLNIGGNRKIELKASRKATSGGRVNTPAIGTGNSGKGNYDKAFKPMARKLNLPVKGGKVQYERTLKTGKISKKELKYTSWGPSLINNVLNPAIEQSNISREEVVQFVRQVAVAPVIDDHKRDGLKKFNAEKTVRKDRTIDPKAFVSEYLSMTMGFYAETDGVEEVLVINPITGNFHVVDARDMSTIQDKIDSGDLQLSSTYLDFTDTQSKASPQIGTE